MYVPAYSRLADADAIALAREHPFALLLSSRGGVPAGTHLPLLVEEEDGACWLRGHVARANPHWREWDGERPALAVFRGPHAYVSPRWYAAAGEVPTWNYLAAHALGRPRAVHDPERLADLLRRMAARFDPEWAALRPDAAERARHAGLLGAVVGMELRVESWTGKAKLGQNRSAADRAGAVAGLRATGGAAETALAERMATAESA